MFTRLTAEPFFIVFPRRLSGLILPGDRTQLIFSLVLIFTIPHVVTATSSPADLIQGTVKVPTKSAKIPKRDQRESTARRQALLTLEGVERKTKRLDASILKVKILAQIADTLWTYEEEHARALFGEAFAAIPTILLDPKTDQRLRIAAANQGPGPLSDLRAEVLQIIAGRDPILAQRLVESLKGPSESRGNEFEKEELKWDIAIASAKSQPHQTAEFFRMHLRGGIDETIGSALVALRRVNQPLANQLFGEAIAIARSNPSPPGQFESLALYVLPSEDGLSPLSQASGDYYPLIKDYLDYVSTRLILQLNEGEASQARAEASAEEYRTLQALLPLFEKFSPNQAVYVQQRMGRLRDTMSSRTAETLSPRELDVEELLRQAEGIIGSRKRDLRLIYVSSIAAHQGDLPKAISVAERISDPDERSIQVSLLTYQAASKALEQSDFEKAYRLAKNVEFLPQRVMVYELLARHYRKSANQDRRLNLLEEIWAWVEGQPNSPQKVSAQLALASDMSSSNPERAFALLGVAIKNINGADFSPTEVKAPSRVMQVTLDMLDIESLFAALAREDAERTLQAAQSLTKPEASLLAQISVLRQVLISSQNPQTN
jgi:hypothetical protein